LTHPLTPREKVARIISGAEVRVEYDSVGRQYAFVRDAVGTADTILTALASDSGDHAELVLMANAALEICSDDVLVVGGTRRIHADNIILYVKNGVDALLAEIAALREKEMTWIKVAERSQEDRIRADARATEAERKLAEAVGLLREWSNRDPQLPGLGLLRLQQRTDHFLSKEAERG